MKKRCSVFALILLLSLSLCTPALAATDYGVIYDETDELGSNTLTMQGQETLPQLSETLGIDLRVDVLTLIGYDSIADAAAGIYAKYDYGYGEDKEGATLTILMEPTDEGSYAMPADGWCIYATLNEERGSSQALADAIRSAVEPSMAARAWNGEDITMSAVALTQAVYAMAEAAEDYILTNCPPDSPGTEVGTEVPEVPEVPDVSEVPETPGPDSAGESAAPGESAAGMEYIFDISDLLSYEGWKDLESRAAAVSQRHHCGVYFALVDDYTEYGDSDVYKVTYQLYHNSQLGLGDGRDGIIVLLSMKERDYAMFVYGEYAEYAFDEFGQEKLEERFLSDFGNNDWYGGISNYLDACDEFLTRADEGNPVRYAWWRDIIFAAGFGCLAAGVVCFWLLRSMKSVRPKDKADAYVTKGGLNLTQQHDQFSHTTVTRTNIKKESSGGSTHSESGGGGSGRSGKF